MSDRVRLEILEDEADGRRFSPSAARNRDDILEEVRRWLPERGDVVEVASGTGEHAVHIASALPGLVWHPTDRDEEALASIEAWHRFAGLENLRAPRRLDVCAPWPFDRADVVVAINFFHITPWEACRAFLAGAADILEPSGLIFVYGAFFRAGHRTAPSNIDFDKRLRETDSSYGVRDLDAVAAEAKKRGLGIEAVTSMPNNNFGVVLRQRRKISSTRAPSSTLT